MQKQTKWLVGLVALLIVANIALVATIWLKKDDSSKPPQGDAREYLIKNLLLNEAQVKAFDSLRKGHFERMNEHKNEMRQLKDALFAQLKEPQNAQADSITKRIGELQAIIDKETFDHFAQLRVLLSKDQAEKFDNTIQNVLRTMGREGRPDGLPPNDRDRMPGGPPPGDGPPPHDGPPH